MKLKVGQTVELNNGEVHEVTRRQTPRKDLGFGPFVIDGVLYHENGRFASEGIDHSLSVKRIIKEPDSKPEWPDLSNRDKVPFEDMTDEQQAFMLLAEWRGEVIEQFDDEWIDCKNPSFMGEAVYRLKPAPPSWLPLEVGKVYVDKAGIERRCIAVEGDNAWLVREDISGATAFVWGANTGVKGSGFFDITGPPQADIKRLQ